MTKIPEFCEIACPHVGGCRILEPMTSDGRKLKKAHARHIAGVNLCKHHACHESGLPAAFLASISVSSVDLILFWTKEKPDGRYIDKVTGKIYSKNLAGDILPTGQTLHEYVK